MWARKKKRKSLFSRNADGPILHLPMLSLRDGIPGICGAFDLSEKVWVKIPTVGPQTFVKSDQIWIPRCSINFYWKRVVTRSVFVHWNIKEVLQRSFRALLKPWKPRYFSSEMVGATVVRFVNGQYNTIRTIQYLRVYCENTLSYTNGVLSQTKPKTGSVKARQLIYRYSTNNKLKARYGIFYNQNYNNKILMQ